VTLASGTRIGSYEILAPLGKGGMGEVYRARDSKLAREVAIKVLPETLAADASRLSRFEKEARTASSLNHPNIVTIYEIGEADGVSFIAMELVSGRTLRELLVPGPIPLKRLLPMAAQVADGLAKAHAAGIVHRDLKPENLMISKDGFVKILDFGLAKLIPGGFESSGGTNLPTMTRATEEGTVLGTVGYMSPEQASGQAAEFRSDQFSFGAILYEMLAGKRAFERPTPVQTLSAVIQDEPEPLARAAPNTPTNLIWVVERCLAKDVEERYASTKDLARDLASLRDHSSGLSGSGAIAPVARRFRPSRGLFAAVVLGAVAAAALAFWGGTSLQLRRDREKPPPPSVVLTYRRGFLTGARFGPDGQTIVYSAAWDGKPSEIFTTRVGSGDSRSLGIFPAGILAVSSSGEMAISLGCENVWEPCFGTLARASLAGGAPREVLENVSSADWSPDGKELAAIHVVDRRYRLEYPIGKVLYQSDGYLSHVRVSPDGNLVAFLDHPNLDSGIGYVSIIDKAGHRRMLTKERSRVRPLLWSPNGKEIFFDHWRTGGGGRLVKGVTLDGRVRYAPWIPSLEDVSRQGLFLDPGSMLNVRRDILAMLPGTTKELNYSWLRDSTAAGLSPDGKQMLINVYQEEGVGDTPEIYLTYLRSAVGADAKPLGEGKALALSPDQQWALVLRRRPEAHLTLLPTGAGDPKDLPGGGILHYHGASFFPDGRRILIAAEERGKAPRTYIQGVDGSPPLPFAEEGMRGWLVSPDGQEIAGTTLEGLQLIYRADGTGRARSIGGAQPADQLVQWSDDGKSIVVRGDEEMPMTLYQIDLATGRREPWKQFAPTDLTGFLEFGSGSAGVRVTPDLRYYAYTYYSDLESLRQIDVGPSWWK
jgi:Tol biopolymer transport system component/predicted Ser/Thr protein kinase